MAADQLVQTDLAKYFADHASEVRWASKDGRKMELVSQTWQGIEWRHDVSLTIPKGGKDKNTCLLIATGGDLNDVDEAQQHRIAELSQLPCASLYHIPNQPLFDDRWEDDLIAYTFEKVLETGDHSWALPFPMAQSVIAAIDAIQEMSDGQLGRFVITGMSKRGWTTWLSAASSDPRIVGICPMVFDNLNFGVQMAHQLKSWEGYSERIVDYTSRGLPSLLGSEDGDRLARLVDPYAYLDSIKCAVHIVNGSNDSYWTVDALTHYFDALGLPRSATVIPNVGHNLGTQADSEAVLSAFARACDGDIIWPNPEWAFGHTGTEFCSDVPCAESGLYYAVRPDLVFHEAEWTAIQFSDYGDMREANSDQNVAVIGYARYETDQGAPYMLTSPAHVFRKL